MTTTEVIHFLQTEFFGNTVEMYGVALGIVVLTVLTGAAFRWILLLRLQEWAKKTITHFDDTLLRTTARISWQLLGVVGIYFGSQVLTIPPLGERIIWGFFLTGVVFYGVLAIHDVIEYFFRQRLQEAEVAGSRSAVSGLVTVLKYSLWALGGLLIASNLGVNVTSLVAGLGVGGVAVAFALQNILEDLFSSFALYFDRPFEVGDFIVIGDQSGTVERIGIKTTRLRALQGEQIVISNRQLTTAQVQNFKKLQERRVELHFGVAYETPPKKLEKIPELIQGMVEGIDGLRYSRTHLDTLGDSALLYEVVYFVEDADYAIHMDHKQTLWLSLLKEFSKQKIEIAYPTQTLWVRK